MKLPTKNILALIMSVTCAIGVGLSFAQNPPPAGMDAGGEAGMGAGMGAGGEAGMGAAGMGGGGPSVIVPLTKVLTEIKSGNYELEHEHGRVHWTVSHHGFSMFTAVFSEVSATLKFDAADVTRSKLDATVNMKSVASQIPAFDVKLNSSVWLDTEKYPTSNFKSTKIERVGSNGLKVTGDLTFLGVTKPAVMEVNFIQAGNVSPPAGGYRMGFNGKMVINRSDWGMSKSTVGDQVTLDLEAEFLELGAAAAH
jgi:polyisoprenoid-binding protein YceI